MTEPDMTPESILSLIKAGQVSGIRLVLDALHSARSAGDRVGRNPALNEEFGNLIRMAWFEGYDTAVEILQTALAKVEEDRP